MLRDAGGGDKVGILHAGRCREVEGGGDAEFAGIGEEELGVVIGGGEVA